MKVGMRHNMAVYLCLYTRFIAFCKRFSMTAVVSDPETSVSSIANVALLSGKIKFRDQT